MCVQACEKGGPASEGLNQWYIRPAGLIVFVSLCVGMCVSTRVREGGPRLRA